MFGVGSMGIVTYLALLFGIMMISSIYTADAAPRNDQWYLDGVGQYNFGYYDNAIKIFQDGLKKNPKHKDAWYYLGVSYLYIGEYDSAIKSFDQALKIDPRYVNAINDKGWVLYETGKYDAAVEAFDQAVKLQPVNIDYGENIIAYNPLVNKGLTLEKLGKVDEAIKSYDQEIALVGSFKNPQGGSDPWPWYFKSKALEKLGKNSESKDALKIALKITPNFDEDLNSNGIIQTYGGKFEEAVFWYDQSISLNPQNRFAWANKGVALINLSLYEDAVKSSQEATKINPKNFDAWINSGNSNQGMCKFDEAVKNYEIAEKISATSIGYSGKAMSLFDLGKYSESLKASEFAIKMDARNSHAWKIKADSLKKLVKPDEAKKAYQKASDAIDNELKIYPRDGYKWKLKGLILQNLDKHADAIKSFEKAQSIEDSFKRTDGKKYPLVYKAMAESLEKLGKSEDAKNFYSKEIGRAHV